MKKCFLAVLCGILPLSSWAGEPLRVADVIARFSEVAPGVYRGAYPDAEGMKALAELGIRTDVNLMKRAGAHRLLANEKAAAEKWGMRFIQFPMAPMLRVQDEELDAVLRVLQDPSMRPVFFHCRHGEDRTGMVAGLFRVVAQGWTPDEAYREMLEKGFHPRFVGVDCSFRSLPDCLFQRAVRFCPSFLFQNDRPSS